MRSALHASPYLPCAALLVVVGLNLLVFCGFFDGDVVKFFRIKNFTAFQAFEKLGIVMPGDDSYSRVFTGNWHRIEFS
ncbi:MAG: hypothetical protein P4L40_18870 [Terracidiphilus sp.]|nr:hypothetical protein [Terracidiphilus sp.]